MSKVNFRHTQHEAVGLTAKRFTENKWLSSTNDTLACGSLQVPQFLPGSRGLPWSWLPWNNRQQATPGEAFQVLYNVVRWKNNQRTQMDKPVQQRNMNSTVGKQPRSLLGCFVRHCTSEQFGDVATFVSYWSGISKCKYGKLFLWTRYWGIVVA